MGGTAVARYILQKLVFMFVSLFALASATFWLMKAIPGDPFMSEKAVPPEVRQNLMEHYGLDKPLITQYFDYLGNVATFDLGMSMKWQHRTVTSVIESSFAYSLQLGLVAAVTAIVIGLTLGIVAALKHRKFLDSFAMMLAVVGVSVPSFVMGSVLQYLFAVKIPMFSVAGLSGPLDYVLPTMALAAMPIAFIARLTRSSMLEVLSADYIKTAKAKGLRGIVITVHHALRNAILPVVTYMGPLIANVITGSVVIESIFGIPGLGKNFVESVENRDYTLIMGVALFYGIILMVARFGTDILYGFVDPRIKLSGAKGVK
jgi:oligopeptide transport system permease protein